MITNAIDGAWRFARMFGATLYGATMRGATRSGVTMRGAARRKSIAIPFALTLGAVSGLTACVAGDDGEPDQEESGDSGGRDVGAAGATGDTGDAPSRTRLGSVTLTGAWSNGNSGTRAYGSSDEQVVECVWDRRSVPAALWLAAGDSGELAAASVWLEDVYVPASGTTTFFADSDSALEAVFRFVGQDDLLFEYAYTAAGTTEGTVATTCSLETRTFDSTSISGHLACRDVIATSSSADYTTSSTPTTASVTFAFDCPLEVIEPGPTSSTGGQSGSGGGSTDGAGGGSAGGSCVGSATPCSLLGSTSCIEALGCSTGGECNGVSHSCYSMFTSYSCNTQDGCFWSSLYDDCTGASWSCGGYSLRSSCTSQDGCRWDDTCEGSAWSCSSFSSALDCQLQPGCSWIAD